MDRLIKIELHGPLKELYPEVFEIYASTPAEAINGFCKQTGALDVSPFENKYCIQVLGIDNVEGLYSPIRPDMTTLHIVPSISGGKSGFFKVIIGVALVALAIWNPAIMSTIAYGTTTFGSMAFSLGTSLLLGGLLEMLSPAPKLDTNSTQDVEASKYLGATQNTVKIGTRIPLLYGRHIAYGHYISFDVDAKDVAV